VREGSSALTFAFDGLTFTLVGVLVANVGADDVVASLRIVAFELHKPRLDPRILASAVAIVAVEDLVLVHHDGVMQAVDLDVSREFVEVLG